MNECLVKEQHLSWDLRNKKDLNIVKKGGLGKRNKEARRIKASKSMNKLCSGQNFRRKSRRQGWKEQLTMDSLECYSRHQVGHSRHVNSL